MSKTLLCRWHNTFQDGFTDHKEGSRPGQPKAIVTNAFIAAVAGLIGRDARLTWQNSAYSVCILLESAHAILTQMLELIKALLCGTPSFD